MARAVLSSSIAIFCTRFSFVSGLHCPARRLEAWLIAKSMQKRFNVRSERYLLRGKSHMNNSYLANAIARSIAERQEIFGSGRRSSNSLLRHSLRTDL